MVSICLSVRDMINRRFYTLGLILLLVIPAVMLPSGCDSEPNCNTYGAPPVELGEAMQGRYTIERYVFEGEYEVVAYLDLADGRYLVIPIEDSDKLLEELELFDFFGENTEGTYTITHCAEDISEETTLGDLDENEDTYLFTVRFESSVTDHLGEATTMELNYHGPRKALSLALDIWWCAFITEFIWKPWE